jgi:triosephosphate isomerase
MPRKIAAGNWKMNGLAASLAEVSQLPKADDVTVLICPPATLLASMASAGSDIDVGGQDCHVATSGAHTGDISALMLADAGATYAIVGHSERRTDHGETSETVALKAKAAYDAGLIAVICLGETLAQRDAGETLAVIADQLAASLPAGATAGNTVIAYEPVWAIGTGKVPTIEQIAEVHDALRTALPDTSLLYGGSVKASNAAEIFAVANVDGALVGGASLKAADFGPIITALSDA